MLKFMRRWVGGREDAQVEPSRATTRRAPAVLRLGSAAVVPMPLPAEPWRGGATRPQTAPDHGPASDAAELNTQASAAPRTASSMVGDDPHAVRRSLALARLDALPESGAPAYQFVADAAAMICHTPLASITLLDDATQWLQARVGIPFEFTPIELSFCRHALGQHPGQLLEVRDTLLDARFSGHPMVRGEPHVRFYAGAPIALSDGLVLGTVCVADVCARALTPAQAEALRQLASHVAQLLESRAPGPDAMPQSLASAA